MKNTEIDLAVQEAEKFLHAAKDYLQVTSKTYVSNGYEFVVSAPKESGALRRASMDLTRQLAKMRKP